MDGPGLCGRPRLRSHHGYRRWMLWCHIPKWNMTTQMYSSRSIDEYQRNVFIILKLLSCITSASSLARSCMESLVVSIKQCSRETKHRNRAISRSDSCRAMSSKPELSIFKLHGPPYSGSSDRRGIIVGEDLRIWLMLGDASFAALQPGRYGTNPLKTD